MAMFHLLKIRTSKDIFSNEKCKVTFGLKSNRKAMKYTLERNIANSSILLELLYLLPLSYMDYS